MNSIRYQVQPFMVLNTLERISLNGVSLTNLKRTQKSSLDTPTVYL